MLKVLCTDVVVSKGFDNSPALRFSEKGDFVRFRVGAKVYDPRADKNTRWVNLSVKGFGSLCERIRRMQIKEGSFINLTGRFDEDVWEDENTHEKRSIPVVILEEIEYCSGSGKNSGESQKATASRSPDHTSAPPAEDQMPGSFTGYESFGGGNSFFDA